MPTNPGIRFAGPFTLLDGGSVCVPASESRYLTLVTQPGYGVATYTVAGPPTDGQTVSVGTGPQAYAYESGAIDAAYKVDIGSAEESLDNLIAAINDSGTPGTTYGVGTVANPDVTAARGADAAATGTLTGTTIADGNTVTIDGKTYTFQDTLTDVDGNVQVGATDSDSLDNLIAAINLAAGAGTLYAASTTLHATVSAAAGAGDTLVATAKAAGADGNALATTATLTAGDWGAATLQNGSSSMVVTATTRGVTFATSVTTDNTTSDSWDEDTLVVPADEQPQVSWSRVDSADASAHVDPVTIDGSDAIATTLDVDWPYYFVSVADGDVRYALSAF